MRTHTGLPSARFRLETTLWLLRMPCTQTRSPCTAIEPYPAPSIAADHATVGPDFGHCASSPVSFEMPLRSGPRHCGQSAADCPRTMTAPTAMIDAMNRMRLMCGTPNAQLPTPNHSQFPTPNSQQLPIGNWELGVVGRWQLGVGSLERDSCTQSERSRPPHLANESRRSQLSVWESDRDVLRVECVANPGLSEEISAPGAGAEVRQ